MDQTGSEEKQKRVKKPSSNGGIRWGQHLVSLVIGVAASVFANYLSFHFVKQQLSETVANGLEIISFEQALKQLQDVESLTLNTTTPPYSTLESSIDNMAVKTKEAVIRAEEERRQIELAFIQFGKLMDQLEISNGPTKIDGVLRTEPVSIAASSLSELQSKISKFSGYLGGIQRAADGATALPKRQAKDIELAAERQVDHIIAEVGKARRMLKDKQKAMMDSLQKLSKD